MRALLGLVALVFLIGCATVPGPVLAPPEGCSWPAFPVVVRIDEEASAYRRDVLAALDAWSDAIGRPDVFRLAIDGETPDVIVTAGRSRHQVDAARACVEGRTLTVVSLAPVLDALEASAFARHGIGHALGVAHSNHPSSVMRAVLDVGLLREDDEIWRPPLIMPEDAAAALRARR